MARRGCLLQSQQRQQRWCQQPRRHRHVRRGFGFCGGGGGTNSAVWMSLLVLASASIAATTTTTVAAASWEDPSRAAPFYDSSSSLRGVAWPFSMAPRSLVDRTSPVDGDDDWSEEVNNKNDNDDDDTVAHSILPRWLDPSLEVHAQIPRLALPLPPVPQTSGWDDDPTASERLHDSPHDRPYGHVPASSVPRRPVRTTGTTIVGVVGKNCVVLGADTRATAGSLVADLRACKIHPLAPNLAACGAGTSADLSHLTTLTRHSLRLQNLLASSIGNRNIDCPAFQLNGNENDNSDNNGILRGALDGPPASLEHACRFLQDYLYERGGACQANLLVGGFMSPTSTSGTTMVRRRPALVAIHPHGSADYLSTFGALGSGGLAATSVLEQGYRPNLSRHDAIQLVQRAVAAGIASDLGSGSQIDVCVIDATASTSTSTSMYGGERLEYFRASVPEESLLPPPVPLTFDIGVEVEEEEKSWPETSTMTTPVPAQQRGVNGFGNAPFAIQSTFRRVCVAATTSTTTATDPVDRDDDSTDRRTAAWNQLLGLDDEPKPNHL